MPACSDIELSSFLLGVTHYKDCNLSYLLYRPNVSGTLKLSIFTFLCFQLYTGLVIDTQVTEEEAYSPKL
jgi:hypothetical protein